MVGLFVKSQKDGAYFKRFQVRYRRRREAKTDYKARRRLIQQDKNKYNTPKYRFVVRLTNRDVIAQIVHSKVVGDVVLCAAYSHELKSKYGISVGLTNYAACYATGLLLARRLLKKLSLDKKFAGIEKVDGKYVAIDEEKKPFRAVLDVGLARTTSGARVFAALKGAVDGGIAIPHSPSRFSGYGGSKGAEKLDSEKFRKRLVGAHVGAYMKSLASEPDRLKTQFSRYIAKQVNAAQVENVWTEVHKQIRQDPDHVPTKKHVPAEVLGKDGKKVKRFAYRADKPKQRLRPARLTTGERLAVRDQRRAAFKKRKAAAAEGAKDDEEEGEE